MDKSEIGLKAAAKAKAKTKKSLKRHKVTEDLVAQRLKEALDAEETKVFCTKEGDVVYSEALTAHGIRLRAIEVAAELLNMKPSKKVEFPDKDGNPQAVGAIVNIYIPDNGRDKKDG
jgi:hypothetical protein